jgi:transposase-like protein
VRQLAERFTVHRTTVLTHLELAGVPRRGHTSNLTKGQVTEAAKCYAAGASLAAIGRELGVDAATVNKELRRAGVQIRPRRSWPPSANR